MQPVAVEKLGIKTKLNLIQRSFAQKNCKAYRMVSLHSALVLAGTRPLELRVRETAALYRAERGYPLERLGGREIERVSSALENPHPTEYMCLEFLKLETREQLEQADNCTIQIFTDGSKIEGKVGAVLSLWNMSC